MTRLYSDLHLHVCAQSRECMCVCLLLPVSDGQHTSPETALTIHLLGSDRQPPAFQVRAPLLEVSPGGRTSLGKN